MFNMFIFANVGHSKFIEKHGTPQILIAPHWYFLFDTGLILRSIKLFIYIQTCVNVNAYAIKK